MTSTVWAVLWTIGTALVLLTIFFSWVVVEEYERARDALRQLLRRR